MYSTEQEIDNTMQSWMLNERFSPDPKTNAKIRERVELLLESGGYVSTSHFSRAYLELLNEDEIQPFRGALSEQLDAAPAISPDTIAFITSPRTTASQLRHRYNTDPLFRKQYDLYGKTGQTRESSGTLSVDDYRQMRAADVVQRYRTDRGFKSSVDNLIAKGLI
jgi:hypothetical protein